MSGLQGADCEGLEGNQGFFLTALSHDTLANYYQANSALLYYHKYSLTEVENMMPWEREVYMRFIIQYLEKARTEQAGH